MQLSLKGNGKDFKLESRNRFLLPLSVFQVHSSKHAAAFKYFSAANFFKKGGVKA